MQKPKFIVEEMATEESSSCDIPPKDKLVSRNAPPPIRQGGFLRTLNWPVVLFILCTHSLALYGFITVRMRSETMMITTFYGILYGLGITAGYHRLWAHRSYNASKTLRYFLAIIGAGSIRGTIVWWTRDHRAHHRYTDTDLDPYDASKGFWHSHIGWLVFKSQLEPGYADVSDLIKDEVVMWQQRRYLTLVLIFGVGVPIATSGLLLGDWMGGLVFAFGLRSVIVFHSISCVDSLAHWLGETSFDDRHTPRDNLFTALLTMGEGYHNFHHEFPMDYRNGVMWYHYDPTKWLIWTLKKMGLASHLKKFPENEIKKGRLTMQLKRLREDQDALRWAPNSNDLPVISWESFQEEDLDRSLVLISGFIHDVTGFVDEHPGGRNLLVTTVGKDATTSFFGGVYEHSNAAHNLLSMMRVGILSGGYPNGLDDKAVPPSQRLKVTRYDELDSPS